MPEIPLANSSTPALKTPATADDVNDLFKELDIPEVDKTEKEEKELKTDKEEKEDKTEKEEKDDDLELVEPDDDIEKIDLSKDDDLEIDAPPRKKEILKKYPEVFKDFPFLEKILFRDKQYNELFGSFDDAKEIAEKAETYNNFESQLLKGNTEEILKTVKESDTKAFDNIVDNYLGTLAKVDKEAYQEVVGNISKRLIMEMVKEANDTGDDDLKQAALFVNRFIFGSNKFTEPTRRVDNSKSDEVDKVEQERLALTRERFESARDDLQTRVDNTLRATITEYIDPRNNMAPFVKKHAIAEAIKILNESLAKDSSVSSNLDKLWRNAFSAKFSKESLGKIQSYYLGAGKRNLKNAILKARSEALKDSSPKREKDEVEEKEETPRKRNIPPGRVSQPNDKNGMKKGETVADYFARD